MKGRGRPVHKRSEEKCNKVMVLLAMDKVAAACKRNGLVPGAFAGSPAIMTEYIARGFNFLAAVVDVDLLRHGAEVAVKGVN